jgi:hypothetical protein
MKKYSILFGAVCALLLAFGQNAKADTTFDSTLSVGNDAISGFPSPYGTVHIDLSGQVATITFTASNSYEFGDSKIADVNVNSTDFTPSIPTGGDSAFKNFGAGNVDGFGVFNLTIDNKDGAAMALTTLTFTVTNNSSTLWVTASDVLAFNSKGFDAAAHIFINGGAVTGYAGEPNGGGGHVPDGGATAALLGLALAGLGGLRAKFGRK